MQLCPVTFKTTGTDTFVKQNMDTRGSGYGVLPVSQGWISGFDPQKVIYKEWVTVALYITYL